LEQTDFEDTLTAMKTLLMLAVLIGAGCVAYFFFQEKAPEKLEDAGKNLATNASKLRDQIRENTPTLDTEQIVEELKAQGKVVRTKAKEMGGEIQKAVNDSQITAAIKGKFALDRDLSALAISVNTTQGKVTLAGTVENADSLKKAIDLSLQTEGVREVTSTLQIKEPKP
jgi:osmotically-inducible protein OsmY